MKLEVHAIQETVFSGPAEKIIARTPLGEITVLDGHIPMISSLEGPDFKIVSDEGAEKKVNLASGFLEIRPGSDIVILIHPG